MVDDLENALTLEEKLRKAQGSLNAFILAAILYLKENDLPVAAFWHFLGRRHARGWDPKMTAIEFLREDAAFLISIGCRLHSLSGDASRAEAVVTSWPPDGDWTAENFLAFFDLSQEDADSFWEAYEPMAHHLGLDYRWRRTGDEVTLTFTHRPQVEDIQ